MEGDLRAINEKRKRKFVDSCERMQRRVFFGNVLCVLVQCKIYLIRIAYSNNNRIR